MQKKVVYVLLFILLSGCRPDEQPENMSAPINEPRDAAQNPSAPLKVMEREETGQYLADSAGMTLYYYLHDKRNVSTCANHCLDEWPPFYIGSSEIPEGFNEADFGVITRPDTGEKQTTYKGYPLYYFSRDQVAGQVNGYSLDDQWYTVNNSIERIALYKK
ncbi:COG4315 family predicted lipoprotein [Domibacillus epiphyticus]|uniref:Lipoprotein n=1 Tax=Domibacillus epiphyticus TaxID=1714355 RepID=A0A1V2A695_9BACI|nr:hypothetical protein [Domibacillus epiphyticus]OMP66450.1 hypothetical protein BTO28_12165 [Domibacillus epiphyticus]